MKHEDGIEVYLRPHKSKRKHGGYAETDLPLADNHGGHCQRCAIDYRKTRVELTIELDSSFDMHGASALHIGLYPMPKFRRSKRRCLFREGFLYFVQHANTVGTGNFINLLDGHAAFSMPLVKDFSQGGIFPSVDLSDEGYDTSFDPSCITLTIQRGNVGWTNEKQAKDRGARPRKNFTPGTFKPLSGAAGKRYIYEMFSQQKAPMASATTKRRRSPKVCSCPDHSNAVTKSPGNSRIRSNTSGLSVAKRTFGRKKEPLKASTVVSSTPAPEFLSTEMLATECGRCKNLKKPGRGRKIAWRDRTKTWMIVDARAPDEEPPVEEISDDPSEPRKDSESEDSEDLQDSDSPQTPVDTDDESANDNDSDNDLDYGSDQHRATEQSIEVTVDPAEVHRASSNAGSAVRETAGGSAVDDERLSPIPQEYNGSEQVATSAAAPESFSVQRAADQTPRQVTSRTPPNPELTGHEGLRASLSLNGGAQSLVASNAGTQRSTRTHLKHYSGKRAMAEIDLTIDDNSGESVKKEIKLEDEVGTRHKSLAGHSLHDQDEAILREELEDVTMAEEEFQIRKRKLLLQRQLKRKLREKGTAMIPIKVEED